MAQMKDNTGGRVKSLAQLWGRRFGNKSWGFTCGVMKTLLKGNPDKGLKAYRYHQIQGCIEWLYEGKRSGRLTSDIVSPNVLKFKLDAFIAGKSVEEAFHQKPVRKVKIL